MIEAKTIRQVFVLLVIATIGILIFREMLPYFSGVLGAITLYVLLKKPMKFLMKKGLKDTFAALLVMFMSFVLILIPIGGLSFLIGNKIESILDNSDRVIEVIEKQLFTIEKFLSMDITSNIDANNISTWLSDNFQSFLGGTFNIALAIMIMYFLLFYMLTNRRKLKESLYEYIPISIPNLQILGKEVHEMVKSNALGIPLVAIAQGLVALIGFFIFDVSEPFLWAAIVTIGSMIPFVGSLLGVVPVFAILISNGQTYEAWGFLIYGIAIIGSTDNIIRLFILKKIDNVHPLITLIGVIIGIPLFGFIGLIFGPLLLSLFLIIVKIYKKEYAKKPIGSL